MTLVADLEARLARAGGEAGVLGYLAERLADAEAVGAELADAGAAAASAERDEERSIDWMRDAFARFPIMNAETFPHSSHVDPRAHAVLATHRLAQRSGLYLPSELRAMHERAEVSLAWRAREGLRFRLFAALARALGEAMVEGGVDPAAYVAACRETAAKLGGIEIAAP